MFRRVDLAILGLLQSFCRWFEKQTGKTNFLLIGVIRFLEIITIVGTGLFLRIGSVAPDDYYLARIVFELPLVSAIFVGLSLLNIFYAPVGKKATRDRLRRGFPNPKAESLWNRCIRIFGVIAVGFCLLQFFLDFPSIHNTIKALIDSSFMALLVIDEYLLACDPTPENTPAETNETSQRKEGSS